MEDVNNPSDAETLEVSEANGESQENVSNVSIAKTINEATGRDYKSDEEAIKGIKETTSYVGKVGKYKDVIEEIEKSSGGEEKAVEALKSLIKGETEPHKESGESENQVLKEVEQLREDTFFLKNNELEPHKEIISRLRKNGQSYDDVVKENQEVLSKLLAHDESQKTKSVIHSNSKLTDSDSTYAKDFEKAQQTGNWANFLMTHKGVK